MKMEKPNFGVNGGIKLPIGYRFRPTDEELVVHYLKRKVFGLPLPASVIPELDVFQTDPWGLPGDLKEKKRYFFSNRDENTKDNKSKIAAGSGYWKPIGKGRQILASASKQAVGVRRTLIFCQGKLVAQDAKTQWVMHEYRLVATAINPNATQLLQASNMEIGDWVVYRIFQRKRKPKKHGVLSSYNLNSSSNKINQSIGMITRASYIDFSIDAGHESGLLGAPQPSSTCSSEMTADEMPASVLDQEETSAYTSFFSNSYLRKH